MNKIILTGRLTRDPESKVTQNGVEHCGFTIAADRRFKNQQTGQREADFIPCRAWRQQSAFICKYFHKGDMIAVEGSLQTRKYQDEAGNNRIAYEVAVDNVEFCGGKGQGGQAAQGQDAPPPPGPSMNADEEELPF